MKTCMTAVAEFYAKLDTCHPTKMPRSYSVGALDVIAQGLREHSKILERHVGDDPRMMRAHLILEETAELLTAMAAGNELAALDATTDLAYVTAGTGHQFGWDLAGAFDEVHLSNMTKTGGGKADPRVRDKGAQFSPPVLTPFLWKD